MPTLGGCPYALVTTITAKMEVPCRHAGKAKSLSAELCRDTRAGGGSVDVTDCVQILEGNNVAVVRQV